MLGDRVDKITTGYQQITDLAEQVHSNLQTTSNKLQDSSLGFIEAAETFKESDFCRQTKYRYQPTNNYSATVR